MQNKHEAQKIFVGNPKGKKHLWKHARRWRNDNSEVSIKERRCESVD